MAAPASFGRSVGIGVALQRVGLSLVIAFGALAAGAGYWQVFRSADLSRAADDAAVIAAARRVMRGVITDRDGKRLAWDVRDPNGEPYRVYASRALSGVLGYASRLWGNAGLERGWDAELSGVVSADPVYDLIRKFRVDPSNPESLRTTLVLSLQEQAVRLLGSDRGAVVMLDPRSGQVLALASTPTFDASTIANPRTSQAAFRRLQADPALPLLPRATQGLYVPGSIFKIVTSIAGLSSGAISVGTTFPPQPAAEKTGLLIDGFRIRDGHHPETDDRALAFDEAVEVSCNEWFALAGLRTGGTQLVDTAATLGFGSVLPFDLPTASSQVTSGGGALGGGFADRVELANAAYGQAETLVTPLQMALVAAAVANGGVIMQPHLVISSTGQGGTTTVGDQAWRQVMTPEVASEISAAMQLAVNGQLGRIFTAGATVPGLDVAGKSGTAQLDPGADPHSWFIGFAPADHPQVVVAVLVEHSGGGSVRASPLAGQLLRAWEAWSTTT